MNESVRDTYRILYHDYGHIGHGHPLPAISEADPAVIQNIIEHTPMHERLREDAKLFLLSNAHLMIAAPRLLDDPERAPAVYERLASDIGLVVEAAVAHSDDADKVSAHEVMSATDRLWNRLSSLSDEYCR